MFVLLLGGESIVNFLSHHEESGLQCIICHALHAANLRYTTLFTTTFDLRRHVTLGDKSPEPLSFVTEATLGMIIVSGIQLLYLCFFEPLFTWHFPSRQ